MADPRADLIIDRLSAAAVAAIKNERPSLERAGPGRVVGITLELALSGSGQISDATCYVERRLAAGALMGRAKDSQR